MLSDDEVNDWFESNAERWNDTVNKRRQELAKEYLLSERDMRIAASMGGELAMIVGMMTHTMDEGGVPLVKAYRIRLLVLRAIMESCAVVLNEYEALEKKHGGA